MINTQLPDAETDFLRVGEVVLHTVSLGPKDGSPVILLHGFPEFWWSWRFQMQALANAGFRAIAPDMRGYNQSSKPRGVRAYRSHRLVADVTGLINALGYRRAHVVGHDWGGAVAWFAAAREPRWIQSLTILNCPHPALFLRSLLTSTSQLRKSSYMGFFQLPIMAERRVQQSDFMKQVFHGIAVNRKAFPEEVLAHYQNAMAQPGAATGALNYYRAALRSPPLRLPRITLPTQVLWGQGDPILGVSLNKRLGDVVLNPRVRYIEGSGHWVQQEAPEAVNEHLVSFLNEVD